VVLGLVLLYFGLCSGAYAKTLIFVILTFPGHVNIQQVNSVNMPVVLTMFCSAAVLSLIDPFAVFYAKSARDTKGKKAI